MNYLVEYIYCDEHLDEHTPPNLRIHCQWQTRPRMDHGTLSTHPRQR